DQAGPLTLESDLAYSTSSLAAEVRHLIAQVGYLLGDLQTKQLSEANRLTPLGVLPPLRRQIEHLHGATRTTLLPTAPMPESRHSAPARTLSGHTRAVRAVAIAPDGTYLAAVSDEEAVRLWEPDGTARATLTGHQGWVNADRKSTRLHSSHAKTSYAVFCLTKNRSSRATTTDCA